MMTSSNNGNSALSDMGYSEPFIEAMAVTDFGYGPKRSSVPLFRGQERGRLLSSSARRFVVTHLTPCTNETELSAPNLASVEQAPVEQGNCRVTG